MHNEQFLEDLAAILEVEPNELHPEFPLNEYNWNSLAVVSTIVLIDEQFEVSIEGEKLRNCPSVGALCQLIELAGGTHIIG